MWCAWRFFLSERRDSNPCERLCRPAPSHAATPALPMTMPYRMGLAHSFDHRDSNAEGLIRTPGEDCAS